MVVIDENIGTNKQRRIERTSHTHKERIWIFGVSNKNQESIIPL